MLSYSHISVFKEEWRNQLTYRAEYLWIDGTEPTAEIRSKTKILADGDEPGIWG